jgi:hypothetical protein
MGPLIIAPLCGPSDFASIEYLAELIQAGSPSIGVNGMEGFKGSTLPDANTS